MRLGPGTLYVSLQRLLDGGLIAEASPPAGADGSHADRRRYYAITPLGQRVLGAYTDRLAGAVRLARSRLGSAPLRSAPARLLVGVDAERELGAQLVRQHRVGGVDAPEPGVAE